MYAANPRAAVHTHIRMLQRLTAQSKQRARMWTSQSLNVLRHPGALGYTEPEAPGDREHARGRPILLKTQ
jgi:hypothetical protein